MTVGAIRNDNDRSCFGKISIAFGTGYMGYVVGFGGTWAGYVVRDTRPLDWRILSDLSESIRAMLMSQVRLSHK